MANLLFSDDFDGGTPSGSWTDVFFASANYTPNTAAQQYVTSPTPVSGSHCVHYYALSGTNEINAFKGTYEFASLQDEVFLEWHDYFETGYPFGTTSQKMARLYYYDNAEIITESRKEITVVASQENLYVDYSFACGLWGDSSKCSTDFANSTGASPHPLDQFVKWQLHVVLNTPGSSDGSIKLYRNDSLYLSNLSVDLRGTDTRGFSAFWVGGNYSQAGGDGPLSSSGSRYIDYVRAWDGDPNEATAQPTFGRAKRGGRRRRV